MLPVTVTSLPGTLHQCVRMGADLLQRLVCSNKGVSGSNPKRVCHKPVSVMYSFHLSSLALGWRTEAESSKACLLPPILQWMLFLLNATLLLHYSTADNLVVKQSCTKRNWKSGQKDNYVRIQGQPISSSQDLPYSSTDGQKHRNV